MELYSLEVFFRDYLHFLEEADSGLDPADTLKFLIELVKFMKTSPYITISELKALVTEPDFVNIVAQLYKLDREGVLPLLGDPVV